MTGGGFPLFPDGSVSAGLQASCVAPRYGGNERAWPSGSSPLNLQQMAAALLLVSTPCCRQILFVVALWLIVIYEKESDVAMMSVILSLLVSLMLLCLISP